MNLIEFQDKVRRRNARKGYTDDPVTLALGVCEEAGELGKAVNMYHNPLYIPKEGAVSDSVKHETGDLLVYVASVANSLGIGLEEVLHEKTRNW